MRKHYLKFQNQSLNYVYIVTQRYLQLKNSSEYLNTVIAIINLNVPGSLINLLSFCIVGIKKLDLNHDYFYVSSSISYHFCYQYPCFFACTKWILYISVYKPRIFEHFSEAKMGGGSTYIRVHISCKKHTSETIIDCVYFMLKTYI